MTQTCSKLVQCVCRAIYAQRFPSLLTLYAPEHVIAALRIGCSFHQLLDGHLTISEFPTADCAFLRLCGNIAKLKSSHTLQIVEHDSESRSFQSGESAHARDHIPLRSLGGLARERGPPGVRGDLPPWGWPRGRRRHERRLVRCGLRRGWRGRRGCGARGRRVRGGALRSGRPRGAPLLQPQELHLALLLERVEHGPHRSCEGPRTLR